MYTTLIKRISAAIIAASCMIPVCGYYASDKGSVDSYSYYYGDLDGDDAITDNDIELLADMLTARRASVPVPYAGDMNDDGKINVQDYIFLKRLLMYGIYPGEPVPGAVQPTTQKPAQPTTVPQEDTAEAYMQEILRLVNEERSKVGAAPLTLDKTLCDAAMKRAEEITEKFAHERPDGSSCFTVLAEYDLGYSYVGENIAAGRSTPAGTMDQWVNSQGHYENIISSNFTQLGVGYVYVPGSTYRYYWVQLFRRPR